VLAIALTREIRPNVLFFHTRYFAPFAALPVLVAAAGLATLKPRFAVLLFLPWLAVSGWRLGLLPDLLRDQEGDIAHLHTAPARFVADNLPPDSRVLVEGAGAMRFFTPRSMTIVDIIGLNDFEIAHLRGRDALLCHLKHSDIQFVVVPQNIIGGLEELFVLQPLMLFSEERYHQTEQPFTHWVMLFAVDGTRDVQVCPER